MLVHGEPGELHAFADDSHCAPEGGKLCSKQLKLKFDIDWVKKKQKRISQTHSCIESQNKLSHSIYMVVS